MIFLCLIFAGNCKRHHFGLVILIHTRSIISTARNTVLLSMKSLDFVLQLQPEVLLHYMYATTTWNFQGRILKDLNFTILYISFSSSRSFLIHLRTVCRMVKNISATLNPIIWIYKSLDKDDIRGPVP